jgi:phage recombination protein Bet
MSDEKALARIPVGQSGEVARYKTPELTMEIVKQFINPNVTDAEAYFFIQFCKGQALDPFRKEAYLIKYAGQQDPASIVIGYHNFLKRAEENPKYKGFKAGIIVLTVGKKVEYREGSFYVSGEGILGGWCEVYRTDRTNPFRSEVAFEEYVGRKKDGTITKQWITKPATMIRKVPVAQAHRDAFPSELGRLYVAEEFAQAEEVLPTYEVGKPAAIEVPEGMEAFGAPKQKADPPKTTAAAAEKKPEGEGAGAGAGAPQGSTSQAGGGEGEKKDGPKMASEPQLKKIGVMMSGLGKKADDERHAYAVNLLHLPECPKVDGKDSLKGLTSRQASELITALDAAANEGGRE